MQKAAKRGRQGVVGFIQYLILEEKAGKHYMYKSNLGGDK